MTARAASFESTRLYADVFWRPFDWFEAQAGVQGSRIEVAGQDRRRSVSARSASASRPSKGNGCAPPIAETRCIPSPLPWRP